MNRVLYLFLYGFFYLISLFPFRILYLMSDMMYLLVYYIVRYRRKLVRNHLMSCFPEKGGTEIMQIEKDFYHWLCDYLNETIKLMSISPTNLLKHFEIRGIDEVEKCFDQGQDCAGILGHYCNWEWLSACGLEFKRHPEGVIGLIYHPLYNKVFDKLFLNIRQSMGGICIPKKDILRYLLAYKKEDKRSLFGYISDQTPKWENIHLWVDFLHHDTPVFTGGERIMRKMNNAVFYLDMERPCRGKYICTYHLITREPQKMEENEITRRFFQLLEESIRRQPAYYLWTHNRWKRTHEEFDRLYNVIDRKVIKKDIH